MTRQPQPTPNDYQTAEQYVLRALAETGCPAGVPVEDFEDAVQSVAKWTAKMRRMGEVATLGLRTIPSAPKEGVL